LRLVGHQLELVGHSAELWKRTVMRRMQQGLRALTLLGGLLDASLRNPFPAKSVSD
jgi:hypothetical protein